MRSDEQIKAAVAIEQSRVATQKDFLGNYFTWRNENYSSRTKLDAAIAAFVSRDDYLGPTASPGAQAEAIDNRRQAETLETAVAAAQARLSPNSLTVAGLKVFAWVGLVAAIFVAIISGLPIIARLVYVAISLFGFFVLHAFALITETLIDIRNLQLRGLSDGQRKTIE